MDEFLATFIPALGHVLLNFLWQGALIGLLAALALHVLRHARPQARYAVTCLALLACVLVPLATLIAQLTATSYEPQFGGLLTHAPRIGDSPDTPGVLFGFAPPAEQIDALLPWMVALWAAGTCVMSLRMALGLAWIRRLRRTPQGAEQAAWQMRLDALAMHFGLRRGVKLRLIDSLDSPVSAGWWDPVVLLPTALLTRMPVDLIEALLAHELAHIRRHDYLVNLLQNAVEALLFYHPVTWWLSRRIRIEREQIADQLAAEVACAPRRLAVALSELSELSELHRSHPAFHLAQAAHGGQLMSRIEQLVRPTRRAHPSARIVFPLLGLAAACIASYAYAQIGKRDPAAMQASTQASRTYDASARETFALVQKNSDGITMSGSTNDLPAIKAAKHGVDRDFLWVRRAGKAYVVTDPSLLARARQAWRETDALSQQMEALSDQMEAHSNNVEAVSKRMAQLSAQNADLATSASERDNGAEHAEAAAKAEREAEAATARAEHAAEVATRNAEREAEAAAAKAEREAEAAAASAERAAIAASKAEREAEAASAEAERLEAQQRPMEALARDMELASKPMEALSKRMEALSNRQEQAAARAERELRNLISEALAKGLAKPAPARALAQ